MLLQEGLSALAAAQRKWVYLEPILARGGGLAGQAGRFRGADAEFRGVMAHLHVSGLGCVKRTVNPRHLIQLAGPEIRPLNRRLDCCNRRNHHPHGTSNQSARKVAAFTDLGRPLERLAGVAAALDAVQRALSAYLEDKRGAFPRCSWMTRTELVYGISRRRWIS
jgi:hypothetical protein